MSDPSYFHRRIFSRLKRIKTQPSIWSSSNQSTLSSSASSTMTNHNQDPAADRIQEDRDQQQQQEAELVPKSSEPTPQLAATSSRTEDAKRPSVEGENQNNEMTVSSTSTSQKESSSSALSEIATKCPDEQQPSEPDPSAAPSPTSTEPQQASRATPIKPSRKSRAIQLFRRAAAGIRSSSDSVTSRHLASTTSRHEQSTDSLQQTPLSPSPSGATPPNPPKSNRLALLALRLNSSLNHSSSVSSNLNRPTTSGQARRDTACSASTAGETTAGFLPRFIVPKTNGLNLPIVCLIKSLDGELMREISIHRYELGQYLIDNLKASLGFRDSKYFGLRLAKCTDDQEDVRQPWLELNEPVYKQISKHKQLLCAAQDKRRGSSSLSSSPAAPAAPPPPTGTCKSVKLYLRVKYYPPNLARIQDPFLRQYLWLQLKRDLRLGKLTSSMNNLTLLMACVLQYQFGDFKPELVDRLQELVVLPNQDLIEEQSVEYWRTKLAGCKKHQVQMQFLRAAIILETYGFDYYPVRDHQRQRAYLLGFNYNGIKTIRNGRIVHHFRWHNLSTISHERRMIIFHIYPTENSKRKQILGFKCLSNDDCQTLYMRILEQRYFFTVDLAYFDKSIRRPSCLVESSQVDHWPLATTSNLSINSAGQHQHDSTTTSDPANNGSFDSQCQDDDEFGDYFDNNYTDCDRDDEQHVQHAQAEHHDGLQFRPDEPRAGHSLANHPALVSQSGAHRRARPLKRTPSSQDQQQQQQASSSNSIGNLSSPNPQARASDFAALPDNCDDCRRSTSATEAAPQKQQQQPIPPINQPLKLRAHQLEKSASLQESNPLSPLSYRAPQSSLSFAAPDAALLSHCSSLSYCSDLNNNNNNNDNIAQQYPAAANTNCLATLPFGQHHLVNDQPGNDRFGGGHAPPLRRQLSTTSRCCAANSADGRSFYGDRRDDELSVSQEADEFAPTTHHGGPNDQQHRGRPGATTWTDHRTAAPSPSVVQQLADLANWLLVPWRLTSIGPFSQDDEQQQSQQQQQSPIPRATPAGGLVPTIRFCLIILLMNFLIRLTDNLTSNLVDLLSFAAANPSETSDKQQSQAAAASPQPSLFGHFGT